MFGVRIKIILKNPIPETPHVSITEITRLILFKEIYEVYCDNDEEYSRVSKFVKAFFFLNFDTS